MPMAALDRVDRVLLSEQNSKDFSFHVVELYKIFSGQTNTEILIKHKLSADQTS